MISYKVHYSTLDITQSIEHGFEVDSSRRVGSPRGSPGPRAPAPPGGAPGPTEGALLINIFFGDPPNFKGPGTKKGGAPPPGPPGPPRGPPRDPPPAYWNLPQSHAQCSATITPSQAILTGLTRPKSNDKKEFKRKNDKSNVYIYMY